MSADSPLSAESRWESQLRGSLAALRIIVIALALGCLAFMVVALVANQGRVNWGSLTASNFLSILGLGMLVPFLGARLILPTIIEGAQRRSWVTNVRRSLDKTSPGGTDRRQQIIAQTNPTGFWAIYQARVIVSAAIIEGATFLLLIAYMIEHSGWTLTAAGVLIAVILLHMPSYGRMSAWADRQWQRVSDALDF